MKFRLLEKFSKKIPQEVRHRIIGDTDLLRFIKSGSVNIDLTNADCRELQCPKESKPIGFPQDSELLSVLEKISNDISYDNDIDCMVFVVMKSGDVLAFPYDRYYHSQGIVSICIYSAEEIRKAYMLFNSEQQKNSLSKKLKDRKKINYFKKYLYDKGQLRDKDYPFNWYSDDFSEYKDKSGYISDPQELLDRLRNYRADNYSDYILNAYNKLNNYERIIRNSTNSIDLLDSQVSYNLGYYYTMLAKTIRHYNQLVDQVSRLEKEYTDPQEFHQAIHSLFVVDGEYAKLEKYLNNLKSILSEIQYQDINWY